MLLQRVVHGANALSARHALRLATRGGADVLGRDDVGYLAPNMAADFIGIRLDSLALAGGAVHDPLAALVFCRPANVDLNVIAGAVRVRDGKLDGVDLEFTEEAVREVARQAHTRGSGARGLRSVVEQIMIPINYRIKQIKPLKKFVVDEKIVAAEGKADITKLIEKTK